MGDTVGDIVGGLGNPAGLLPYHDNLFGFDPRLIPSGGNYYSRSTGIPMDWTASGSGLMVSPDQRGQYSPLLGAMRRAGLTAENFDGNNLDLGQFEMEMPTGQQVSKVPRRQGHAMDLYRQLYPHMQPNSTPLPASPPQAQIGSAPLPWQQNSVGGQPWNPSPSTNPQPFTIGGFQS